MTKLANLESYLNTGAEVTAKQITGMFGLKNPHQAIRSLREKGVCVYGNQRTLRTGETVNKYRVGRPSRAIVAAGLAAVLA